jgi:choline dehydrogenase-like flavoprotein
VGPSGEGGGPASLRMNLVVGSGPAGLSAAVTLIAAGQRVTMLDAGIDLERENREALSRLSARHFEQWDPADVMRLKGGLPASVGGIPQKLVYGSTFPYRDAERELGIVRTGVDLSPSFAVGGLSNVWGAAVLPYREADFASWPIDLEDLEPSYEAVLRLFDLSQSHDGLAAHFPLYSAATDALRPSRQAEEFLADLEPNRTLLSQRGVLFGRPRLAVRASGRDGSSGCVYCGLCLHGCPYGLIYSSRQGLEPLRTHPAFSYVPDVVVERVAEESGRVHVLGRSRTTGSPVRYEGERVYLAAGVLPTARILLTSLEAYAHRIEMRYSQYFLFPFLRYRKVPGVERERLHTLAQLFMELDVPEVSPHLVHLQFYTYNDLFQATLRHLLGPFYHLSRFALRELLGRLLVVQGYLHSADSPGISIHLEKAPSGQRARLVVTGQRNAATRQTVRRAVRHLHRNRALLRGVALGYLVRLSAPGGAYHNGGTFPMRSRPGAFETDVLGRPAGLGRVHIVDASVLPSLPATTITLTVMANAHRIARASLGGNHA